MSPKKRSLIRTILTANGGCGCGKPKRSDVYEPTPKPKPKISVSNPNPASSVTSSTTSGAEPNANGGDFEEDFTFTTFSEAETDSKSPRFVLPKQSPKLNDSVAIEKDSENPYKDFRHSMLQMIFEKEIFSRPDLQDLLQCFLQLNSPSHHQLIVRAFNEICEQAFPSSTKKDVTHHQNQ
ncbi:hypothetical protein L6164_022153 [Bauhinia variegata]|uniref:Uncharacterized protein n=1 Tax=Bauhinia variegata TaxID=167791 RepID=A0ACB9MHL9_BAUVA|nr:hypothetical protein L6164_022153 [Bauhinia variegata]